MCTVLISITSRNWTSKADPPGIHVRTPVKIVVDHELEQILQMRLVWLKHLFHNGPLLKKLSKPSHDHRVEHIDLEVEPVADVEAIEGNSFHKGDSSDVLAVPIVDIAPVAHGQGVVNGEMQTVYVSGDMVRVQTPVVLDVEIGEGTVDMSADLLAGLRGAEDPHNGDLGLLPQVEEGHITTKPGVIFGWGGLIVVYAVQTHSEDIHDDGKRDGNNILSSPCIMLVVHMTSPKERKKSE